MLSSYPETTRVRGIRAMASHAMMSAASDKPMVKLDGMPGAGNKLFDFVR